MKTISMESFINKLKSNAHINIIDVRNKCDYDNGHIDGAINIPVNVLLSNMSNYLNKDSLYYIYCQFGSRSMRVVDEANYLEYSTVNIEGGYNLFLLMK